MSLFNEFGALVHQPSLDLSDQIHELVSQHCELLIKQGCSLTEIRALGFYFNGDSAVAQQVLTQAMKLCHMQQSQEVLWLADNP